MKNKLKFYICSLIILSITIISSICYTQNKYTEVPMSTTSKKEKIAYLTFDDGPSKNTDKILSILDKYNIKATFFVSGPSYTLKNEYLKKIVSSGHEIAIHSFEHNYNYIYSSKENYLKDFYKCLEWIEKTTGKHPVIYRFPGGSSNTIASKDLIKSIIKELKEKGFTHADWNVDTLDSYVKNDPNKIVNNALTSLKRNENNNHYHQTILMHDDINKNATIKALPSLIEKLIDKGYCFKIIDKNSTIVKHINI